MKSFIRMLMAVTFGILLVSCVEAADAPQIEGEVVDRNGGALEGVFVSAYGVTAETEADGRFALGGISNLPSDRVVVNFQRQGFFDNTAGQPVSGDGTPFIKVALTARELAGTFDNGTGGSVSNGTVQASFEGDSFASADGGAFQGNVNIYTGDISPDSEDFGSAMPGGDFSALSQDEGPGTVTSFGAFQMSAEDDDGNDLQLSREADICLAIPSSMRDVAPDTMPVWRLNGMGLWEEIATATRNGNQYCFDLNVMGAVNCDLFNRSAMVTGAVCDDTGSPVGSGLPVDIHQNTTSTDDNGEYAAIVPSGQEFNVSTSYGSAAVDPIAAGATQTVDINCEPEEEPPPDYAGPGSFCAYNYPQQACEIVCGEAETSPNMDCGWVAGTGPGPCGDVDYDQRYDYGYDSDNGLGMGPPGACILTNIR